jgi:hypothetical protein
MMEFTPGMAAIGVRKLVSTAESITASGMAAMDFMAGNGVADLSSITPQSCT